MRGATQVRWAACAVAVALAATACGGGDGDGGGSSGADGIVSSSWGDPQNPLEPANTNEVQGGKVLDMVFRGLIRYDPKTGEAENMIAESIDSTDSQNFTIKLKDGWTFSNGEKVTAKSFVDAWNYGAALKNNQKNAYFFQYIEGYDKVHPESGSASAETLSGLKVVDDLTFTAKLTQKFSLWPDTLGYSAFVPLPKAFYDDHDAWLSKPVGNGPYTIESYAKGSSMNLRKWDDYPGDDKAKNGGVDLKVFTDNNTAYTDLTSGNLDLVDDVPASQLRNVEADLGDRYINTPSRHHPDPGLPLLRQGVGHRRRPQGPPGPLDGDQPAADHRPDLPEDPHPRLRLDLPGPRRRRRLQEEPLRQGVHVRQGRGQEADRRGRRHPRRPA